MNQAKCILIRHDLIQAKLSHWFISSLVIVVDQPES